MLLTKWGDRIAIYFGVRPVCKYHHRKVMNAGSFDDLPESYRDGKLLEVLDHPDNQMARIFLGTDHVFLTPSEENRGLSPIAAEENRGLSPIAVSQLPSVANCPISNLSFTRRSCLSHAHSYNGKERITSSLQCYKMYQYNIANGEI